MPVNHQIAYDLQDALNLLPDLSDQEVTQSFASTTNDELLVVYLSSLLRAVIALHALVDNKATIGRAEMEEGSKGKEGKEKVKDKEKDKEAGKEKKSDDKKGEKEKTEEKGL
jgi:26S proteasome regulatory subunit N8